MRMRSHTDLWITFNSLIFISFFECAQRRGFSMKSESERYSLSVRLPSETIKRIEKSGESAPDWFRRAARNPGSLAEKQDELFKERAEPPKRPLPPPLPRTRL